MEGIIIKFSIFAMGDDDTIGTARDFYSAGIVVVFFMGGIGPIFDCECRLKPSGSLPSHEDIVRS
jgi:hypothetical protein